MHALARHLLPFYCLSPLERNAPTKFGECCKYNRCYYTMFDGEHATVEEFIPGPLLSIWTTMEIVFQFQKMPPRIWRIYSWKHKLWFTIAMWLQNTNSCCLIFKGLHLHCMTAEIIDKEHHEIYVCCGNCSSLAITAFQSDHMCNEYFDMMDMK